MCVIFDTKNINISTSRRNENVDESPLRELVHYTLGLYSASFPESCKSFTRHKTSTRRMVDSSFMNCNYGSLRFVRFTSAFACISTFVETYRLPWYIGDSKARLINTFTCCALIETQRTRAGCSSSCACT